MFCLLHDNLNSVREISHDFLCVGVSGLCSDLLLRGRPFGGCSILYRKSLSLSVTSLHSCSNRFVALRFVTHLVCRICWFVCSYIMPIDCGSTSYNNYLNTLGELEGFIVSHTV